MSVYDRINYDNYVWYAEVENHEKYLKLLDALERHTAEIEYVQRDGNDPKNDTFYKIGEKFIISEYHTTEWTGIAVGSGMLYKFRADNSVFKLLRTYESFFGPDERKKYPDCWNDWAFYDKNGVLLFYTVPHEYEAHISSDFLKELNNDNQKRKNQNNVGKGLRKRFRKIYRQNNRNRRYGRAFPDDRGRNRRHGKNALPGLY